MDDAKLLATFQKINIANFPSLSSLTAPLQKGLWVLLVSKESNTEKQLTAEQIASILLNIYEDSVTARAITNALNRAGNKIHLHRIGKKGSYEIMKPGKDFLSNINNAGIELFCFEPEKKFTSKKLVSEKLLNNLKGDLKIVDPYCGEGALDILHGKNRNICFLTRLDNLRPKDKARMIREIKRFKPENPKVEFKDYAHSNDIHDRYIISTDSLVLLGCSLHGLGNKESFAIALNKNSSQNMMDAMVENFNRRWSKSITI